MLSLPEFVRAVQLREIANSIELYKVTSLDKALAVAQAALEKKAYDLVVLEVEHLNSMPTTS